MSHASDLAGRDGIAAKLVGIVAGMMGALVAANAVAATPSETCEAGKNGTAGKYAACLQKSQSKYLAGGSIDSAGLASVIASCGHKYTVRWGNSETKAGPGVCPKDGDVSGIQNFLDACVFTAQDAIGGGALPLDVTTCNTDLGTCNTGLANCTSDCVATVRPVLGTGQVTSYGPGSDGDLQKGAAHSFTDNGDGTITDNVTSLMWEKKSDDGSIHDWDNYYSWGIDYAPFTMNGTMVTTFLAELNNGSGFAGHTDWRIPNRNELLSLSNVDSTLTATFSAFNNNCTGGCTVTTCSCTQSDEYWSSTSHQHVPYFAWYVHFDAGSTVATYKTDNLHVRAVRAGS